MRFETLTLRCDDNLEALTFTRCEYDNSEVAYDLCIEDCYNGGEYKGFWGRVKRSWKAFWAKPVEYNSIYTTDKDKVQRFLDDCLALVNEDDVKTLAEQYKELSGNEVI